MGPLVAEAVDNLVWTEARHQSSEAHGTFMPVLQDTQLGRQKSRKNTENTFSFEVSSRTPPGGWRLVRYGSGFSQWDNFIHKCFMEKFLLILSSPKTLLEGIVQTVWKVVFSFVGPVCEALQSSELYRMWHNALPSGLTHRSRWPSSQAQGHMNNVTADTRPPWNFFMFQTTQPSGSNLRKAGKGCGS